MSQPPAYQTSIFNSSFFTDKNSSLTVALADKRFVKFGSNAILSSISCSGTCDVGSLTVGGQSLSLGAITGVTPGTAANNKALILGASGEIATIASLTATSITGTLQTAAQPNITSLGILSSLSVTNGVSASTLTGTLQTAPQPNITSVGTLSSLSVTNGVSASTLTGTLQTAAQPNITSVGTLSSLSVTNGVSASTLTGTLQTAPQPNITSVGTLSSLSVTNGVSASTLTGTLQTAAQPNITSLGILSSLSVTNGVSASTLTGTLQTAAQPNITSVGTLSSLSVTNGVSASTLTGTLQTAAQPNITSVGTLSSLSVTNGVSASTLTGTLQTAAQPNITSLGILSSLSVTNGVSASTLTGTLQTAAQPNIISVGTLSSLSVTNGVSASTLTGTLQTAPQPNITSVGTLSSLSVTNGVSASTLTGTLQTAAQPNITSLGTLSSLTATSITTTTIQPSSNTLNMTYTTLNLNSTALGATATQLNYNQVTTLGTFQSSKTMTLDSNGMGIMGLGSVASNCLRFYGSTANKEMLSVYRDNDDSGLVIATKAQTIQKLSPLLILYSGIDQTGVSGTSSAEYKEVIRAHNKLVSFSTNYQSGWFNGYLLAAQSWGGTEGTQFYSSANTLNLVANSSSTSSFTSGCNLLLTSVSSLNRLCFNTTSPYTNGTYGSALVTLNNGNMYIKCSNSFNDGTTSYDMPLLCESSNASPVSFGIQLNNGANSTSTNAAYFGTLSNNDFVMMTNNSRRLTILGGTNAGRVGIGTATPTAGLQVALNVSQTIDSSGSGVAYFLKSGGLVTTIGPISSVAVAIQATGAVLATAGVYTTSDARRKNFFDTLDGTSIMNGMLAIKPQLYRYKSQDTSVPFQIGYKAQDLLKNNLGAVINYFPNETLVVEDPTIDLAGIEFSIDYSKVCCYLHILALEQQKKINAFASTNTDLTTQLAAANTKIADHETRIKNWKLRS